MTEKMSKKIRKIGNTHRFGAFVLSDVDADKFAKSASAHVTKVTKSKEIARNKLHKLGTHTPTGRLSKKYG